MIFFNKMVSSLSIFLPAIGAATLAVSLALVPNTGWSQASVKDPWARPTVQGQVVGGGYLRIDGGPANDRLLSATAEIAQSVELHTMRMEGDIMRMRQLDAVEVPAGNSVEFRPGGLHLMLLGLKTPLKVGNSFPLTLRFEKSGDIRVNMAVLPAAPAPTSASLPAATPAASAGQAAGGGKGHSQGHAH